MQIDVTARIVAAKEATRAWSEAAGYLAPLSAPVVQLSQKANDIRRILAVSAFGCQERNVQAICEVLLGEKLPDMQKRELAEYANRQPFVIGSVLVPAHPNANRAGLVTRLSNSGNAGLRLSNGEMHNNHYQQRDVRPATDAEIDQYFAEFFGVAINPDDASQVLANLTDDEVDF